MNVLDTSVVVDALATAGPAGDDARRLLAAQRLLRAPALLSAEVTSALRSMFGRGDLTGTVARQAAGQACALRVRHYPFEPFLGRVWQLRENVTTYDAWWLALAEHLGTALVTADQRLQRAVGPHCPVLSVRQALQPWPALWHAPPQGGSPQRPVNRTPR